MSESDVLARAAAALRAAHDGRREGSGFTRARILGTLSERRRPRPWRWLVAAPLASLLLVGSAWAQSTGSWSRVWQAVAHGVASVLPFVQAPERAPAPARRAPTDPARPAVAPEAPAEPAELEAPAVSEPPVVAEPPPEPPPRPRATPPRAPAAAPARPSGPARPEVPADPELRAFRSAHELHVRGEARAAIAAYGEYLRAYPRGRFVPEARYNTALDSIKLGDTAAARAALEPFAAGAFGGYRQQEARELLEALPR